MPVDSQSVFCPNPDCPARGQVGQDNIGIHSQKEGRYRCQVCNSTFAATKGTPFYRLHKAKDLLVLVVTLLAHGCPVQAIVVAFDLDERTVLAWQARAGEHCQQMHEHLVEQPRDLGQVQADELRVKIQGAVVWMAMALQVRTRLWLGGAVSPRRDTALITALIEQVRRCALCRPLLFCVDGFRAYVQAIQRTFREPLRTGGRGRPRLRPWDDVCIAQVVKRYRLRRVVGIVRRVVQGTMAQVDGLLTQTQGSGRGSINTAYSERLNGTFRSRLVTLVRKGRGLARQVVTLQQGMYLVGTVYNFCTPHESLRLPGLIGGRKWLPRTPAMAAGITDHCWSVEELLMYHVPLPRWRPPKRRGRPSRVRQQLIARWCS